MATPQTDVTSLSPYVEEIDVTPPERWIAGAWRRFRHNIAALISLVVLTVLSLAAAFAPLISRYDPFRYNIAPDELYQKANSAHILGTDVFGRDVATVVLYGLRAPLGVAFGGAILCLVVGTSIGILSGFYGGLLDNIIMRAADVVLAVPGIMLLLLVSAFFGSAMDDRFGAAGRPLLIILFMATDEWPLLARLARVETLRLRETQFVEAATIAGGRPVTVMRRHVFPNLLGILLVRSSFMMGGLITITILLSVLGLTAHPEWPDIGNMIRSGFSAYDLNPWILLSSVTLVATIILACTFIGDGLRDAFDVKSQV